VKRRPTPIQLVQMALLAVVVSIGLSILFAVGFFALTVALGWWSDPIG
jgi:hypothetical protein